MNIQIYSVITAAILFPLSDAHSSIIPPHDLPWNSCSGLPPPGVWPQAGVVLAQRNYTDAAKTFLYQAVKGWPEREVRIPLIAPELTDASYFKRIARCDTLKPSTPTLTSVRTEFDSQKKTYSNILNWSPSIDTGSGLLRYTLERKKSTDSTWRLVSNNLNAALTSFIDRDIESDTTYSYRLSAWDKANNPSGTSPEKSVIASTCLAPPPPLGRVNGAVLPGSIYVNWSKPKTRDGCETKYNITVIGQRGREVVVAAPDSSLATIHNLLPNSTTVTITPRNALGSGQSSSVSNVTPRAAVTPMGARKRVVGFYPSWSIWGRNRDLKSLVTNNSGHHLTHLVYSFGGIANGECKITDPDADYALSFNAQRSISGKADAWDAPLRGNFNQLKQLKAKYPSLKVMIALGGHGDAVSKEFREATSTPEKQAHLVQSCIQTFINGDLPKYNYAGGEGAAAGIFDGFDIDWEFPESKQEGANLTALINEFRRQLDALPSSNPSQKFIISASIGVGPTHLDDLDFSKLSSNSLDFLNLMTYDLYGPWNGTEATTSHAPLFGDKNKPLIYPIGGVMDAWQRSSVLNGIRYDKLNLGIPFYGRGWSNVGSGRPDGLNNKGGGKGKNQFSPEYDGTNDFNYIAKLPGTIYFDPVTISTYKFNGDEWWGFDDPRSIERKADFARRFGLNGVLLWDLSQDDQAHNLLKATGAYLNGDPVRK